MAKPGRDPLSLSDDALRFVREELLAASVDFDGPLARRLSELDFGTPFCFLSPKAAGAASELRRGGIDDGGADRQLAAAVSEWLCAPDPGYERLTLLEEPLGRRSDPADFGLAWNMDDRVYFAGVAGDSPDDVARSFACLSGYPGVGVLSCPRAGTILSDDLTFDRLSELAATAAAVLVRAWDDEAFVVVPVADRLTPTDLGGSQRGDV